MAGDQRVALRGDAGPELGGGHLARLGAVARVLHAWGRNTELIGSSAPRGRSGVAGHQRDITGEPVEAEQEFSAEAQIQDAAATLAALEGTDVPAALVDHYRLGVAWEEAIRGAGVPRIVAIDDLPGRPHVADVLVDPNLGDDDSPRLLGLGKKLEGPGYAPLSHEYREGVSARVGDGRPRLLITLGGGRSGIATELARTLGAERRLNDVAVHFVVPDDEERDQVQAALSGRPHTEVLGRVPSLAPLLANCDLALGAGGVTSWERLRFGVPSVIMALAPNQRRTCRALDALGVARWIDPPTDAKLLAATVVEALADSDLHDFAETVGPLLVDGRGAERVALALQPPKQCPRVRPAKLEDAASLLIMSEGARDDGPSHAGLPVDAARFSDWLKSRLSDAACLLLVAETTAGLPVAQVRFDRLQQDMWSLSYQFEMAARGNGWSGLILHAGVRELRLRCPSATIITVINGKTEAARSMVQRLGFRPASPDVRVVASGAEVAREADFYILTESTAIGEF